MARVCHQEEIIVDSRFHGNDTQLMVVRRKRGGVFVIPTKVEIPTFVEMTS